MCFGRTKNGLHAGEAVIFFNRELSDEFAYRCKQGGQLASKMRFLSAPWFGMLKDDVWLRNARHANDAAAMLEKGLVEIPGVKLMFPREANAVFVALPEKTIEDLRAKGWKFYTFIGVGGARFMCSWDTNEKTIKAILDDVRMSLNIGAS